MGKHISIVGQQIGNWLVLEEVGKDKKSNYQYKCECQCKNKTIRIKTKDQIINSPKCINCRNDNKEKYNYKGKQFNKLIVISDPIRINNETFYDCKCICGNEEIIRKNRSALKYNHKCHCGCENNSIRHGESNTRVYGIWSSMNYRCSSHANEDDYKCYYGRGIRVCKEWNKDNPQGYSQFKEWAFNNGYDENLSIERIDVNGNYCPENCTWIPLNKQALNKQNTIYLNINEEIISLNDYASDKKINKSTILHRYKNGTSEEELLSETKLNNTSGVTGVSKNANKKRWRAYITINKKRIHLGTFDLFEDAVNARKEAEEKYYNKYEMTGSIIKTVK